MTLQLRIFQHLLPRARAWRTTTEKTLRQFFEGLGGAFGDWKDFTDEVYLDLFPDTTRELDAWEKQFGIQYPSSVESERRAAIAAEWQANGGQSPSYIQGVLQAAGFPVYIHEWWESGPPYVARDPRLYTNQPLIGSYQCTGSAFLDDQPQCSPLGPGGYEDFFDQPQCNRFLVNETFYLVNKTLRDVAPPPVPDDPAFWPYFLYFGGETFPDRAFVDPDRREEFERLLLKLCPTQQWIVLLIDYELIPEPQIWLAGDGSGVGQFRFGYVPTAQRTFVELPVHSDSASDGATSAIGTLYHEEDDRIWVVPGTNINPNDQLSFSPDIGIFQCGTRIISGIANLRSWAWDDLGRLWVGRVSTGGGGDTLFIIDHRDPDDPAITSITTGNRTYWDLWFDPVRRKMFAYTTGGGLGLVVRRYDVDTLAEDLTAASTTAAHSGAPRFVYAPDRDVIITSPDNGGAIAVYDPDDLTGVRTILTGSPGTDHAGITYDPVRGFAWSGDHFGERTVKIDLDSLSVAAAIAHPSGKRHTGAILYEPLTENYEGSGQNTGDRIWSMRIGDGSNDRVLMCIDPDTDTIEDSVTFPATTESPLGRMALRPKKVFSSSTRVDPDDDRFLWEDGEYLAGWWKAGAHNDISAGRVTRIVDLSGLGRHMLAVGDGGTHVASDATLNGKPSILCVAGELPHYQSDGFGIADLMGNLNLGLSPYLGGDAYTIVCVYSVDSLPASGGAGAWKENVDCLCGGLDYTTDADGSGFILGSWSSGSAQLMGAFYGPASDGNSKSTVSLSSPSFGIPRAIVARKFPSSQQIGFWKYPATSGSAPSNSGESVLTDKTAPFEFFHLTDSSRYATVRWAETIVFSRALKVALLRDWLYERTIKAEYGTLT